MTDNCIFCKIAEGEIPAQKVYEDALILAFRDIQPQAPTHILVIPKQHISSIAKVQESDLLGCVLLVATQVARDLGLEETGYRLVCNHGKYGGQTVDHLHVHVLGGRQLGWPPG